MAFLSYPWVFPAMNLRDGVVVLSVNDYMCFSFLLNLIIMSDLWGSILRKSVIHGAELSWQLGALNSNFFFLKIKKFITDPPSFQNLCGGKDSGIRSNHLDYGDSCLLRRCDAAKWVAYLLVFTTHKSLNIDHLGFWTDQNLQSLLLAITKFRYVTHYFFIIIT